MEWNGLRMNAEVPWSRNPLRMVQNKLVWLDLTQNKLCLRSLCVTNVQRHLRQSHQVFQSTALLSNTSLLHWYAVAMVTPVPHLTLSDMMPPHPHLTLINVEKLLPSSPQLQAPFCSHFFADLSEQIKNICVFVHADRHDKPWIKAVLAVPCRD